MENLSEKIVNEIQKKSLKPTPRWVFTLKRIILWLPGILCTLIGSIAIYGIIYGSTNSGWEFRRFTHPSTQEFILESIPYIWILSFILFYLFTFNFIRKTNEGYKYKRATILLSSFLISVILGELIFILINKKIFYYSFGFEKYTKQTQINRWSSPEQGRVLGVITDINNEESITITDKRGKNWIVNINKIPKEMKGSIQLGGNIRVLGDVSGPNDFIACALLPWDFDREALKNKSNKKGEIKERITHKQDMNIILDQCKKFDLFKKVK